MDKAQVSFEFLITIILAMILLLLGVGVFAEQTIQSNLWIAADTNSIECNKIADSISDIYISKGVAEKTIAIQKVASINRIITGGKSLVPGQIVLGNYSCNYFGNAERDSVPATPPETSPRTDFDASGDTNTNGFSLEIGKYKLIKMGGFVVFTKLQ